MSIIQSIRDKAAWIISVAIGLALIAFIAQDASIRSGSSLFGSGDDLARVNGQSIGVDEYNQKVEMVNQMNGGQTPREQLSGQVYNIMVQQAILRQEYEKLGLAISGKEKSDLFLGANPPQWLQQAFTDPKTGQYNAEAARQQLAEMQRKKNDPQVKQVMEAYINPTLEQALAVKYQKLVAQAVYVPKWMGEKMNADNNAMANAQYVFVPYTTVADSLVKVTDAEIDGYVAKHKDQFLRENETRSVNYVTFDAQASSADSAALRNNLQALRQELATTTDEKSFVSSKASEMDYNDAFVTGSSMKMPNADSIKALPIGGVYGPYIDGTNLVIAKMVAKRSLPDSVKVRHILVKTSDRGTPTLADSLAKKRIDSVQAALAGGADFNQLVQTVSQDDGSKGTKGEYDFASQQFSNISREFAEVAFYGNTGDKKVVKVDNSSYGGYHYIEVLSQKNVQPAYKVAYVAKPLAASSETIASANTAATQFAAQAKDKESFEANAKKAGKMVMPSGDLSPADYQVGQLGSNRAFVRQVFEAKAGKVLEPMEFGDRFVVAYVSGINPAGVANAATARAQVEPLLRNEKKAQKIIAEKFKGNTLEAYAQSSGSQVQRADSIGFQAGFIPGVGAELKVVGLAFNKAMQNKVSEPVAGASGVFAVKPSGISARPSLGGSVDQVRQGMASNLKQQVSYRSLEALRLAAEVKDNRARFF